MALFKTSSHRTSLILKRLLKYDTLAHTVTHKCTCFEVVHNRSIEFAITIDMVKKAISKMKSGKAAGPSGIVVEMIKAAGDTGATMIRDLATAITCLPLQRQG